MKIEKDRVVGFDFVLSDEEDNIMDSSDDEGPLFYLHGQGQIVPGLEKALVGKTVGDTVHVKVDPVDGYGEIDPDLVRAVPHSDFEELGEDLEVGMQFEAESEDGPLIVTVTEIDGDQVTVDANHPLAGMTLNFDVTVTTVREATPEELEHGHPHEDGHHH